MFPRCSWICDSISTGCIGLNVKSIRAAIQDKNKKAEDYDWRFAEEKWLLIVAEGGTLGEHVGASEEHAWVDVELSALCDVSPFDRIYFWEYPRFWYKSLKPNLAIVTKSP